MYMISMEVSSYPAYPTRAVSQARPDHPTRASCFVCTVVRTEKSVYHVSKHVQVDWGHLPFLPVQHVVC